MVCAWSVGDTELERPWKCLSGRIEIAGFSPLVRGQRVCRGGWSVRSPLATDNDADSDSDSDSDTDTDIDTDTDY